MQVLFRGGGGGGGGGARGEIVPPGSGFAWAMNQFKYFQVTPPQF